MAEIWRKAEIKIKFKLSFSYCFSDQQGDSERSSLRKEAS